VAETRIGGNPELELAGGRLLTILRGWVGDDLEELVGASIYRESERWSRIWTRHTAAGGKEALLVQWIRGLYRGGHSGDRQRG
jgi:hypothetical protein